EQGYVNYERYRGLVLTAKGREVACRIQRRHETLARFFSLLGLDPGAQRRDIEGIEHHLSPATVALLADLAAFFEKQPETLQRFLASRNGNARDATIDSSPRSPLGRRCLPTAGVRRG